MVLAGADTATSFVKYGAFITFAGIINIGWQQPATPDTPACYSTRSHLYFFSYW
jgi:hypothetical protein